MARREKAAPENREREDLRFDPLAVAADKPPAVGVVERKRVPAEPEAR